MPLMGMWERRILGLKDLFTVFWNLYELTWPLKLIRVLRKSSNAAVMGRIQEFRLMDLNLRKSRARVKLYD